MREGLYWEEEERRRCRICGEEEETWEHIWERCLGGGLGDGERWEEVSGKILSGNGGGEDWMKKIERVREGREREGEEGRENERERRRGRERERRE